MKIALAFLSKNNFNSVVQLNLRQMTSILSKVN